MFTKIKYQQQLFSSDCAVACLAMLIDEDIEWVTRLLAIDRVEYLNGELFLEKLKAYGNIKVAQPCKATDQFLIPGNVYILVVPAIHQVGKTHLVLLDYRDTNNPVLLDPAPEVKYSLNPQYGNEFEFKSFVPYIVIDGASYETALRTKRRFFD
ncbi:hypothetical protein KAMAJI_00940 [Serratia phage vB_SmaM-Kamaji]|nr:hypothetical protein KAMAJI_00940 [Serratia phage vB_SmaM-Kamaji]